MRTVLYAWFLMLVQGLLLLTPDVLGARQSYEAYYRYLGEYPADANPGWHEDVQGLTHDQGNWFITQTAKLWKVPVTHDLGDVSCGDSGVVCKTFANYPELMADGYNHMGDPEFFEFGGQGFILVPLEELEGLGAEPPFSPDAIAVFRADTLQYVDHAFITAGQGSASWCAVDPQGALYSSDFEDVVAVNKFIIDWNALKNTGTLTLPGPAPVRLSATLHRVQGGVVSPSGELLYVAADGIQVIELSTGQRIKQSTNGSGLFNYEFTSEWPDLEEPEGLTIWDLDDGKAPGIRGQLHVLLLDNDIHNDDDVNLKHYTNTIHVDRTYGGIGTGTVGNPFHTLVQAHAFAWDGARISAKAASYPETLTISKRVQVVAK